MPWSPSIGKNGVFIIIGIILSLSLLIYWYYKSIEGFSNSSEYPVNLKRINYEDSGSRRYNNYADLVDIEKVPIIPNGPNGDKTLNNLLITPTVEGTKNSDSMMGITYSNELPYKTPPEVGSTLGRILMCESVKTWDCEAFEDPTFAANCGICTDGIDHLGNSHIGGLYVDPGSRAHQKTIAKGRNDKSQKVEKLPTAGKCKGKFITKRPFCDIQKDRFECSRAHGFDDAAVRAKCSLCAFSPGGNKFVYTGVRGEKDMYYALIGHPLKFASRLRFAVTDPGSAVIVVTRNSDRKSYVGSFIPNTNVYIVDLPECTENELYNISIKYPDYDPYIFTQEEVSRINGLKSPKYAPLTRAMYGPKTDTWIQDDPRAIDVSPLLKKYNVTNDCSKPNTFVTDILFRSPAGPSDTTANFFPPPNVPPPSAQDGPLAADGRGIDPSPGIQKQLRLEFSDGKDIAYSYGLSGQNSQTAPMNTEGWDTLCNMTPLSTADAEKQVCEIDTRGNRIPNRFYTGGNNSSFNGIKGNQVTCVKDAIKKDRGIVGIWESKGSVPRHVPIDLSVTRLNGLDISAGGVHKLGTLTGSSTFTNITAPMVPGIPINLFWFWSLDSKVTSCDIEVAVPATLMDPTLPEDLKLCPTGPLISTKQGAARLNKGSCEKLINGVPQGPGTFSDDCIKTLYLSSGCKKEGALYPSTEDNIKSIKIDKYTDYAFTVDEITDNMNNLYSIATKNIDKDGAPVDKDTYAEANMNCLGISVSNPCDTPFKNTGPHSVDCLDYLFRNAGKSNESIGATYLAGANRSSGTDRSIKTPIMFCQRGGSLAPIGANGKVNDNAVTKANSYGSLNSVKEFYKKVHNDANYNTNPTAQQLALDQCYGVGVKNVDPLCRGTKARYIRLRPAMKSDSNIQISQIAVFNVLGKNVSTKKPTKSTTSLALDSSSVVDGRAMPRVPPDVFITRKDTTSSKSVEFWQVDLGKVEEIAYVVYYNIAGNNNILQRSIGTRVQLVDQNNAVVKQELLKGGLKETIMFSNAKPADIIKINSDIIFSPSKYLDASIALAAGGEALIQPLAKSTDSTKVFTVLKGNTSQNGTYSFQLKDTEKFLRVQGFRVRISEDDGSSTFKSESSFQVSDSIIINPGEVSFESVSTPGSYLSVSENMGVYITQLSGAAQRQACSWSVSTL